MKPTRRRFLAGAGALAVAGCGSKDPSDPTDTGDPRVPAPDRAPEPDEWVPAEPVDEVAFAWGVQVGDATADGALVHAWTTEPTVELVVVRADGDGWTEVSREAGTATAEGHVAFELTGLTADTAHRVVLISADGARRSPVARLRTALGPDGWRKLVLGATSCLGGGNPDWDNVARVAEQDPDLFLLLGDTVYADGAVSRDEYRAFYRNTFAKPSMRTLFGRSSIVATWDDHEVSNNWVLGEGNALQDGVTEPQVADATAVFREALPQREGPGGTGIWRKVSWGPVLDVFVLDSRGERGPGRIVSDEQLAWVLAELRASDAVFKLVLCSVHLADHYALLGPLNDVDRWQGYPDQRDPLAAACAEVPGTLVITGDMHYSGLQRLDPEGGPAHDVWEVAAGPGGSELFLLNEVGELKGGMPEQYDVVLDTWSSCRLVLDPGTVTATVQFVGDDGEVLAERILTL